ncbi:shieldin complex subunit 1 isoform X2 [Oryctolagus cuniculus]|uniref:shieldin complex subunit 1 isoform X2 n=1 Tax=Oryctolagus cuniculus TaxID=9986 RepID=UPI0022304064|nr:shieldin complex subunit 1 isoform X3 [Oryctolagus cuniculus]
MEAQEATPGSQSQESCVLDLPSACDVRDYVLQRSCQKPDSEAFSSVEFHSFPCSSDVDPGRVDRETERKVFFFLWFTPSDRCGRCTALI